MERWLVVDEAFSVAYRGTMLAPPLPAVRARPKPFAVELRRPDGVRITRTATATGSFSHPAARLPDRPVWICLVDGRAGDVPAGTEVWAGSDDEP